MLHQVGLIWVKFPTVRSLINTSEMPGDCPGGGGGWVVLELTGTLLHLKLRCPNAN